MMKKMKIAALLVTLLLGFTLQAKAQSATAFDYTGVTASEEDVNFGPMWVSGEQPDQIWPYEQAGEIGLAQQFTITQPTNISTLDTSVVVYGHDPLVDFGQSASTTLTWSLYSGTQSSYEVLGHIINEPIPLISSLVTQSDPETVTTFFNESNQTVNEQLAFDADLQPGTYWITETGTGLVPVVPSQTYSTVPEPPTVALFGFGLLLLFWKIVSLRRFKHI